MTLEVISKTRIGMKEEITISEKKKISSVRLHYANGTEMQLFSNGKIVIRTKITSERRFSSFLLSQFLELEEVNQSYPIKGIIYDYAKPSKKVVLKLRQVVKTKKGNKSKCTIITNKLLFQSFHQIIEFEFMLPIHLQTSLFRELVAIGNVGYDISLLKPLLRRDSKQISLNLKTILLRRFRLYLEYQDQLQPLITISLNTGKKIQCFDQPGISFILTIEPTISGFVSIPQPFTQMLTLECKFLPIIRAGKLALVKIQCKKNRFHLNLPVDMKEGTTVTILTDESGNELYQRFIEYIKEGGDYRSFFAYITYQKLWNNSHCNTKEDNSIVLNKIFQEIFARKIILPITDAGCKANDHKNQSFHYLISTLLHQLQESNSEQEALLVFPEARIADIENNHTKVVDWYLVHYRANHSCQQYVLELKTSSGNERTRVLQQTISEYGELALKIPEIGTPIIIISWLLDKNKWTNYSDIFGVRVLDISNIYSALTTMNILSQFRGVRKHEFEGEQQSVKEILAAWIRNKSIPKGELLSYVSAMSIQVQHFLHLLNYQKLTLTDASSQLYRYQRIKLAKPEKLFTLHKALESSTKLIVEEELSHCLNRIKFLQNNNKFNSTHIVSPRKKFERRRQTTDITRLKQLSQDLTNLLQFSSLWSKSFRPVGVKMLSYEKNEGKQFEEWTYQYLCAKGFIPVRNVILMVGNYSREIDLVAFSKDEKQNPLKVLVTCSDCSNVKSKFIYTKKVIFQRILEIQKFCEVVQFDFGLYFIRVTSKEHEINIRDWIQDFQKVAVIIVRDRGIEEELAIQSIHEEEFTNRCHREVSFESIYIVMQFFGGFIIYIYRRTTSKKSELKKRKEIKKTLTRVILFRLVIIWDRC